MSTTSHPQRHEVVVAGPSSRLTIPGLIVTEIVNALAETHPVTRIEVDLGVDFEAGLHRAPSLAALHSQTVMTGVVTYQAPHHARFRAQAFRRWITPEVRTAVAFAWPSLDNSWIRQFVLAAQHVDAAAVVVCMSLPNSSHAHMQNLIDQLVDADLVLVGSHADAADLRGVLGPTGPLVEVNRALSLHGRSDHPRFHEITAFLPRNNTATLATLLAAFDAIPEAWVEGYQLNVVMRYESELVPQMVADSYHCENVRLISEDLSSEQLEALSEDSSAVIVADPAIDSRAFAIAVSRGIATVVLAESEIPKVGQRYVGGLLADVNRPVSVHVALTHAIRLADLQFPGPEAWGHLATRIVDPQVEVEQDSSRWESVRPHS